MEWVVLALVILALGAAAAGGIGTSGFGVQIATVRSYQIADGGLAETRDRAHIDC